MHRFVQWYNNVHKHSGLKFVTPSERHGGKADEILAKRRQVYATAREQVPRRWTRGLRDWDLDAEVWLNPERTIAEPLMQSA
jgi:hypothetical protein